MYEKVLILFPVLKEMETQTAATFSGKRNTYRPHQYYFRDQSLFFLFGAEFVICNDPVV
jgi:hypothetical protein